MSRTVTKKIDWRSLCYGVDNAMDAPEPGYIFTGKLFYYPMKRNKASEQRNKEKKGRPTTV